LIFWNKKETATALTISHLRQSSHHINFAHTYLISPQHLTTASWTIWEYNSEEFDTIEAMCWNKGIRWLKYSKCLIWACAGATSKLHLSPCFTRSLRPRNCHVHDKNIHYQTKNCGV